MNLKQRLQFRYASPRAHTAIAVGLAAVCAFALTIGLCLKDPLPALMLLYVTVAIAAVNYAVKLAGPGPSDADDGDSDKEAS